MAQGNDTEAAILDAARKVFVEMGPKARMQDIADEADITQSLLHYYFRKRDDLYRAVLEKELRRFLPEPVGLLVSDQPLETKLEVFARKVIDFHAQNPHLAAFVAFETHYNDEHLERLREAFANLDLSVMQEQIDRRAASGEVAAIDAEQLLTNVLALCIFPFISRPILQAIYGMDDASFDAFVERRREAVPQFVRRALYEGAPVFEDDAEV
jgi:AcrR family transcriptional regulator